MKPVLHTTYTDFDAAIHGEVVEIDDKAGVFVVASPDGITKTQVRFADPMPAVAIALPKPKKAESDGNAS